ncbi:hypothetical protein ACTFR8_22105 [Bacillus cereus group sp. MYBK15-3]|uniref:hypothetical protein n=1 Tax=Bacillus cereus group TaxID=86661 RepID=UPI001C8CACA2|nr:hypothetical protein [Bacillus cereus]MBX9158294.1 hypothetical protein [Bacillus cereus]
MQMVEFATCRRCGKAYKGVFIVEVDGTVHCTDCKNPEKVAEDIMWEDSSPDDAQRLYRRVSDMLIRDIQILYPQYEIGNESYILRFYKEGEFDPEKLYFMGNSIDLAEIGHRAVYACLAYLDTGATEYSKIAERVVYLYMDLRERLLDEEETAEFWRILESEDMDKLYREFG